MSIKCPTLRIDARIKLPCERETDRKCIQNTASKKTPSKPKIVFPSRENVFCFIKAETQSISLANQNNLLHTEFSFYLDQKDFSLVQYRT